MTRYFHRRLSNGVEFAAEPMPERRTVAMELRMLTGMADEPPEMLGLAHLLEQTIDKGTAKRDGRALSDAFDAIGARRNSWAGRECIGFTCTVLPERVAEALELHAEMIRSATFPEDACHVAVDLALQEIKSMEDEPGELADKLLTRQAYGPVLGRHALGEPETLRSIAPEHIRSHWSSHFAAGRLLAAVAGPIDVERVADQLERLFADFGEAAPRGREPFAVEFSPVRTHCHKELEQEQIGICFPGVGLVHDDFPVQRVIIGVLSEGMSSRLFTEVREKQGLAYSVQAWHESPRGAGMIHMHASTTPERCDKTYATLLREVDRLGEDLTDAERERTIAAIVARTETRGDITRAHCAELANDLFHYGHPVPIEVKLDAIRRVANADIRRFLNTHPRDRLSVVTLGPKELNLTGEA
jgi:predicted Zn-dependent peptidase